MTMKPRRHRVGARVPLLLLVPGVVGAAFLVLPLAALVQRAPWGSLLSILTDEGTSEALRVSVIVSVVAAMVCVVLGTPLAWLLARGRFVGRGLLRALVLLPLVLPPVVGGTALLFLLGRRGLVGRRLDDWFGITLPFSTAGAVVAATFVALPFFVLAVESALRQADPRHEEVASSLGARPATVFMRVTLPTIWPSIIAGAVLSWARALGEFGATLTFAGNSPGRTRTLPLEIFLALESDPDRALALSLVLVAVSVAVILGLRDRWWPA